MDPFTIAMIGTSVMSAYSSYSAGQQQQLAYENQAMEKERLASLIMEDFEANAKITKREGKKFISQQQTAFAASGVDIATGSPLLAMEDSILAISERVEMDRRKAIAEASSMRMGAGLDRKAGSGAADAGMFQAIGTLGQGIARAGNS